MAIYKADLNNFPFFVCLRSIQREFFILNPSFTAHFYCPANNLANGRGNVVSTRWKPALLWWKFISQWWKPILFRSKFIYSRWNPVQEGNEPLEGWSFSLFTGITRDRRLRPECINFPELRPVPPTAGPLGFLWRNLREFGFGGP